MESIKFCRDCGAPLYPTGKRGKPRSWCTDCRPSVIRDKSPNTQTAREEKVEDGFKYASAKIANRYLFEAAVEGLNLDKTFPHNFLTTPSCDVIVQQDSFESIHRRNNPKDNFTFLEKHRRTALKIEEELNDPRWKIKGSGLSRLVCSDSSTFFAECKAAGDGNRNTFSGIWLDLMCAIGEGVLSQIDTICESNILRKPGVLAITGDISGHLRVQEIVAGTLGIKLAHCKDLELVRTLYRELIIDRMENAGYTLDRNKCIALPYKCSSKGHPMFFGIFVGSKKPSQNGYKG